MRLIKRLTGSFCLVCLLLTGIECDGKREQKKQKNQSEDRDKISGLFVYWADAAILTDCKDGKKRPVAMEKDYISAERAYFAVKNPAGQPCLIKFEGYLDHRPSMEGDRLQEVYIIEEFIEILPDTTCRN